ncbi:NUDIX hydrolase [Micromonospora fulviviridis]|uniref:NUDIX hydrolase n=1 Tax=Micromonospora fulviviridis TaxID=47860 RepID=A0ABV2VPH3_9ACTN
MTTDETSAIATPHVAAGALFVNHEGHVLLVRPTYKQHWDIPGGYVEPGESPRDACVREVREELGLDISVGPMLVVDWAPADNEGDKLLFIFDGGMLTIEQERAIRFLDGELAEWRHVDVDAMATHVPARLDRRIRAAVTARDQGHAAYAEHGVAVPRLVDR